MLEIRAVLRNTVIRKDAVYVLEIEESNPRYTLTAYWGKWPVWLKYGTSRLQSQEKVNDPSLQIVINTMNELLLRKLAKHYEVQEEYSQTPGWYVDRWGYICMTAKNLHAQDRPRPSQVPVAETIPVEPKKPVTRWTLLEL